MSEQELIYTVARVESINKITAKFTLEIIDEYTLKYLEKKYPGQLMFDGGRVFTLIIIVPLTGMSENDATLWRKLQKTHPDIVNKFILQRLRGEV